MAKDLARAVGYTYIDSGAMYRAVTLYARRKQYITAGAVDEDRLRGDIETIDIAFGMNPETGRTDTYMNSEPVENEIRSMDVAGSVSLIASLGFVRRALVAKQRAMGRDKGVVMDGRDIGTVVFPDAELKIFVTASPDIRAGRRVDELRAKGQCVSFEEVLNNVKERDRMDMTRKESPLIKAADALELDNSHLTIAEQQTWLLEQFTRVAGR
jgi:cytidylate kinase